MSLVDNVLFGGSQQETRVKPPAYITDASKRAVGLATDIANQPYQQYGNPRVAGLSSNQNRAARRASELFAQPQRMVTQGFNRAKDVGARRWNEAAAQRYMNPFVESALDPVIRRINEESQKNAIGTRAGQIVGGGVGAFGDARTGVLEGEIEESRLRGIGDTLATGYASAYDRAQQAFGSDLDRALRSADLMGTQGGRLRATTSAGIADLASTGATQQAQEQRSLDTAYGDFLEQRDWGQRGLDAYIRALEGVPYAKTQQGNTGPSTAQQAVGLGTTVAGLWNLFS